MIKYGKENGFAITGLSFSPITGGEGNIEFLAYFTVEGINHSLDIQSVVKEAHLCFRG